MSEEVSLVSKRSSKRMSKDVEGNHDGEPQQKPSGLNVEKLTTTTTANERTKRNRNRSSNEHISSQLRNNQTEDADKLRPTKSDNPNKSKLPVIKVQSNSSSSEDVPKVRTKDVPKNLEVKKRTPTKRSIVPNAPDVVITSTSQNAIRKDTVRTPVEMNTMTMDISSETPKKKKNTYTPEKRPDVSRKRSSEKKKGSAEKLRVRRTSAEKRKARRRSSFVIGRISKAAPALSSSELCENIPLDVPDEERLAKLTAGAFEYTLDKLQAEFGEELDGFQQLRIKSRCAVEEGLSGMKDLFMEATTKLRTVPNPVNVQRAAECEQLRAQREHLAQETSVWDRVLRHHCQQAQEAKQQYDDIPNHYVTKDQCSLNARQKIIVNGRLDLDTMLQDLHDMKETTVLALDVISARVQLLSSFGEAATKEMEKQAQILTSKSFPRHSSVDPRTLIDDCLRFK